MRYVQKYNTGQVIQYHFERYTVVGVSVSHDSRMCITTETLHCVRHRDGEVVRIRDDSTPGPAFATEMRGGKKLKGSIEVLPDGEMTFADLYQRLI